MCSIKVPHPKRPPPSSGFSWKTTDFPPLPVSYTHALPKTTNWSCLRELMALEKAALEKYIKMKEMLGKLQKDQLLKNFPEVLNEDQKPYPNSTDIRTLKLEQRRSETCKKAKTNANICITASLFQFFDFIPSDEWKKCAIEEQHYYRKKSFLKEALCQAENEANFCLENLTEIKNSFREQSMCARQLLEDDDHLSKLRPTICKLLEKLRSMEEEALEEIKNAKYREFEARERYHEHENANTRTLSRTRKRL